MTLREIINKLHRMRNSDKRLEDTDRNYELKLTIFANEISYSDKKTLIAIIEKYQNSRCDIKREMAYSAFFALIIYFRHQLDLENLEDTWNKYHSSFQDFESYNHLQILLYLPFVQSHHLDDDLKYLKMALENANKHTENPGYNHAFADLFASIYEKYEYDFNNLTNFESYRQLALDKVELAIDQEETTAVYYCTKARIISILGRYNEAESLFLTAISKEIVNRTDYSLRIGKFQYYKLLNQTRKQISEATQRTYELKENIEQTKKEFE